MANPIQYTPIPYEPPEAIFQRLQSQSNILFLDSALQTADTGRYSFIGIDPVEVIVGQGERVTTPQGTQYCEDPFAFMQTWLQASMTDPLPDLPPFQCGLAGVCSYDSLRYYHPITLQRSSGYYDWAMAYYDLSVSFDHVTQQAWIVANGYPESSLSRRIQRATQRIATWLPHVTEPINMHPSKLVCSPLQANFTTAGYQQAVQQAKDYIREGDIFEVNLAQRFTAEYTGDPAQWYQRLRAINPAPFAGYTNLAGTYILSSSPERFIRLSGRDIEARPIKGTMARNICPQQDRIQARTLEQSTKDRAENIMIVDLMRNDLSRVSDSSSVKVPTICGVETYANVHHLVSVITSRLTAGASASDLLRATFPAGSITGAPKNRAMEIIALLEPHNRGPYCGSMGYMSSTGDMDWNVMIRSVVMQEGTLHIHSGGAVTLHSCPQTEYEETVTKVMKLAESLGVTLTTGAH